MLLQKQPSASAPLYIRLRDDDNVAIVANQGGLHPGAEFAGGLRLIEQIPQGHKVALLDIAEGAAMIRTKGEAGTGDVVHAVQHLRAIVRDMRMLTVLDDAELYARAKELQAPYELVRVVARTGKLPVPNFSAGGIATPADAALLCQLGAEAVFVGSGIFMNDAMNFCAPDEAERRARAIVRATTHFQDPAVLLEVSEDLIGAMKGLAVAGIAESELLQKRGW